MCSLKSVIILFSCFFQLIVRRYLLYPTRPKQFSTWVFHQVFLIKFADLSSRGVNVEGMWLANFIHLLLQFLADVCGGGLFKSQANLPSRG